jgi:hypothetical protein
MGAWTGMLQAFVERARRPLPPVDGPTGVPDAARADVVRSLRIFQRGESGEGRIAVEIERFASTSVDDEYRAALKLFVAEEGRHARILGALVRSLGADVLGETWTARLFVVGRRLLGVRLKLLVLLAAEVVGIGFYGLIAARLDDGSVRRALAQICADEEHHLSFHRAFFAREAAGARRAVFLVAWWTVGVAACAAVLIDHRRTLRALGVSTTTAARRLGSLLRDGAISARRTGRAAATAGTPTAPAARRRSCSAARRPA